MQNGSLGRYQWKRNRHFTIRSSEYNTTANRRTLSTISTPNRCY